MDQQQSLAQRVRAVLFRDHRLSSRSIEVREAGGVVELRGAVQSWRRRSIAVQLAASVEGCREVVDSLEVSPAVLPDAEVESLVRQALEAHADIHRRSMVVRARAGAVSLTGTVSTGWERRLAEDVALGCRGVRKVNNDLVVDAQSSERDEALADEVSRELRGIQGLKEHRILVGVSGMCVSLSGEVDAAWKVEAAVNLVEGFRPWEIRVAIEVRRP